MNTQITPELKDTVLKSLLDNHPIGEDLNYEPSDTSDFPFPDGLSRNTKAALFQHFKDLGLIEYYPVNSGEVGLLHATISLKVEAVDFIGRGAFVGQEKLFHDSVKKLLLELEDLKPNFPEKANTITSIITNITSFLSLATNSSV